MLAEYLACTEEMGTKEVGTTEIGTVVELGAGIGLVGMVMCKRGKGRVYLTDQEYCLPLMEENVKVNFKHDTVRPVVRDVQWGEDLEVELKGVADIIVASDVLYREESFPLLKKTLLDIRANSCTFYLCFETRDKEKERKFLEEMEMDWHVEKVDEMEIRKVCGRIEKQCGFAMEYGEEIFIYRMSI